MFSEYIPTDRRHALASGDTLPTQQVGTALFGDIVGFTALAGALERHLGSRRGAEELTAVVHRILDPLFDAVDAYGGAVVSLNGDSITCWFDADEGARAVACGLDMQSRTAEAGHIHISEANIPSVGLKVSVTHGRVRRFQVGDPAIQLFDCVAGSTIDRVAAAGSVARAGEVLADDVIIGGISAEFIAAEADVRVGDRRFVNVKQLTPRPAVTAWPPLHDDRLQRTVLESWVPRALAERLNADPTGRATGEFRHAAALFAKFNGLDFDHDEEAGAHLDAFVRWSTHVVREHGGHVLDLSTGDKGCYFLAVFGALIAHGDDADRAVAAAHHLRQIPADLRPVTSVQIGVNAGRVYSGTYAGRVHASYRVVGQAVNLAARLMEAANPGQVLITSDTAAGLGRRFTTRLVAPRTAKGHIGAIPLCELCDPASLASRLDAPTHHLPLIGRDGELQTLSDTIAAAIAGRGTVVSIFGDAGIGKSRLVAEGLRLARAAGMACYAGECQSHGAAIAYLPWQSVWQTLFAIDPSAAADERAAAFVAALSDLSPETVPIAPLFARLVNVTLEDNHVTGAMPAPVRKQVLEASIAGCLRARAQRGPVCLILEDCHWIDPLSSDLLRAIAESIADMPVVVVTAYRTATGQPFPGAQQDGAPRCEIQVRDLTPADSTTLAALAAAALERHGESPTPGLLRAVTDRANGNPFYIEELVRYVFASGVDVTRDEAVDGLLLPPSVEMLVLSRVDRLTARQQITMRVASVVGQRFSLDLLTGAYAETVDRDNAAGDLHQLVDAGLVTEDMEGQRSYSFRHAIVREAVYETLPFSARERLHEELGAYLEEQNAANLPVDLLAYHYARSANRAKEAQFRQLAAELAVRTGAYGDALQHGQRALSLVQARAESVSRLEVELELQLLLGTIMLVLHGQGSREARDVFDRCRELAKAAPPGSARGRATFGLWTYYLFQGLMGPTAELADEAVALAEAAPDPSGRIMAQLAQCQTHLWTGQWRRCAQHFDQTLAMYDPASHRNYITQYAQNPRFTATASGFWATWALGYPQRSCAIIDAAVTEAAALNHDFTYVIAFQCRPILALLRRQHDVLHTTVDEFVSRARRAGNPFYFAFALALQASAMIGAGSISEGLAQLAAQDAVLAALGSRLIDPFMVALKAEVYLRTGRYDEGRHLVDSTWPEFVKEDRPGYLPEHLRLAAELRLAVDPKNDEAEHLLRRALAAAREQEALAFELRTALSLARLLVQRGHYLDARRCVAAVYSLFTEGFEDPDLIEAAGYLELEQA